jgi:hypothetical protein
VDGVEVVYGPADLDRFLDGLDVLVIAAPLTQATHGLIGARELGRLARGALLVNVGRAQIVDEPALLAAAASHGVGIEGLSVHSYTGDCPPGLVLGHAHLAEPAIERGVRLLIDALEAMPAAGRA